MTKPIFATPDGVAARSLDVHFNYYKSRHAKDTNCTMLRWMFVAQHWNLIASVAYGYRESIGTNGVLVIHRPTTDEQHIEYLGNKPVSVTYMTPSEIASHCDIKEETVLDLLDRVASYDHKLEAVVVVIHNDGSAEYYTYGLRPSPQRAISPRPLA